LILFPLGHDRGENGSAERAAQVAHHVEQPDAANFLGKQPPKLEEVREALSRIVEAGTQATESIERIRNLFKKRDPQKAPVDIVFTERGLRDESSTAAPLHR
jgi:hypothetical protein